MQSWKALTRSWCIVWLNITFAMACTAAAESVSGCAEVPHGDHPKALLTNGKLGALVFLPDTTSGYYRSTRFDWSGVVGCVSLNGHRFFGEWFPQYDPLKNDSITGPVEEFRTDDGPMGYNALRPGELSVRPGAIGYHEARPGETFLKPGVGVLRKVDDSPYQFGGAYPIVDTGTWTVKVGRRSVRFRQVLRGSGGYAYVYEKTLTLDKHEPVMTLQHSLKNTGKKAIETYVYDHDFFMLDGKPTGPGMVVHFKFEPKPQGEIGTAAKIEGKDLVYVDALAPRKGVAGYLTGYSDEVRDYNFTVEDTRSKVGVQQTSDHPLARLYFWSTQTTICPEGYIKLNVAPGETSRWTLRYRFFAPPN
jgi:hypothetical protein